MCLSKTVGGAAQVALIQGRAQSEYMLPVAVQEGFFVYGGLLAISSFTCRSKTVGGGAQGARMQGTAWMIFRGCWAFQETHKSAAFPRNSYHLQLQTHTS